MPVWEAPDDDATRPSYNVAPGYYEPVYRAMVPEPDHGAAAARDGRAANGDGDDGTDEPTSTVSDDQARREKQKKKTKEEVRYQLQAMKWGECSSPHRSKVYVHDADQEWRRLSSVLDEAQSGLRIDVEDDQLSG